LEGVTYKCCCCLALKSTSQHLTSPLSYVAYVDRFTMSMTHGFTIKAPAQNEPTYFDLTGTSGRIVYTNDHDQQIAFDPCVQSLSKRFA
jgi:hypothetical protein